MVRVAARERLQQVDEKKKKRIRMSLGKRETVEVVKLPSHERVQQRTVEAPMPQNLKETVKVTVHPHERVQQRQCLPKSSISFRGASSSAPSLCAYMRPWSQGVLSLSPAKKGHKGPRLREAELCRLEECPV